MYVRMCTHMAMREKMVLRMLTELGGRRIILDYFPVFLALLHN